jgi:hypothetical protein
VGHVPEKQNKKEIKKEIKKNIKPETYFILKSGGVIKSLEELAMNMDTISYEDFAHHVNDVRNDFANWIRDVIKEEKLAEELAAVRDKNYYQVVLLKHLLKKR